MFQLTDEEWKNLRSQIVTFVKETGKYKPWAFAEHGILMAGHAMELPFSVSHRFVTALYIFCNLWYVLW
jgi:hypothetical protein